VKADQAWQIAIQVFRWQGSGLIEEHRDQGYMLTSFFLEAGRYGNRMEMEYAGPGSSPVPAAPR
jgi:hypothetical protein